MEHDNYIKLPYLTKKFNLLFIIFTLLFFITSCKEENPNPELLDPIYSHLLKKAKDLKKEAEENKKSIEQYRKELKTTLPRSAERIVARKSLKKAIKKQAFLEQKAKFYEIRAEHRKFVARKAYKIAFRNNKKWPDPKEYEYFITNNRLKEVDLNWGARVPKLFKENPNYKAKQ